jgi:hypothetical protein
MLMLMLLLLLVVVVVMMLPVRVMRGVVGGGRAVPLLASIVV